MNRSLQRFLSPMVLVLMVIGVAGCFGMNGWEYPPQPSGTYLSMIASRPLPASLLVLPMEDLRGTDETVEYWKVAIPLVSSGVASYERPEKVLESASVDGVLFDPPRDFSRALADEIREVGIFSSVMLADPSSAPPSDLIMSGRLQSTRWERHVTTYFLGPVGTVLWILGLPMGYTTIIIELNLQITPTGSPSTILWSSTVNVESHAYDSLYYGLEGIAKSYPVRVQDMLRPVLTSLVTIAEHRPEVLTQSIP